MIPLLEPLPTFDCDDDDAAAIDDVGFVFDASAGLLPVDCY